jgi:phosphate-selective porin OprO/OprP
MSFRSFVRHGRTWRHSGRLTAVVLALAIPGLAGAQAAPAPTQPSSGWQNGFFIQSANGDTRIVLGTVVQVDGKFTTDDPPAFTDTFTIRKARPTLTGRVARYFDFKLTPEFGNGSATVLDASFDTRFSNAFRVRLGKDKTPIGMEVLYSDPGLLFPERSLASSLLPNRDVGVQVLGDLGAQKATYALGVFNGIPDGSSSSTDVDTNSGKDVAGRLVVQPFRRESDPGALNNFGVHVGASHGQETGALPSFKTSGGQTYFSYAGAAADGDRWRVTPAFFYYGHTVGVFGEYARTSQDVTKAGVTRAIVNDGWDLSGAINLTGETATNSVIPPAHPFDPASGSWGTLQLVARYAELHVDQAAFDAGFTSSTASREAKQFTIGLNWYPVQFVKYYLDYEHTTFEGGAAARPAEHVIFFRGQLAF